MREKYIYFEVRNAEMLYNLYVNSSLTLDYSDTSDLILLDLKKRYNTCLEYLKSQGIGGVLINGIFRDLSN